MKDLPFPKKDVEKGLFLQKKGCVKSIIFSEGTYQVEVFDDELNETFWPFVQLDDMGKISDCFCTCKNAEEQKTCEHLSAALFEIYKGHLQPLHLRFRSSFGRCLETGLKVIVHSFFSSYKVISHLARSDQKESSNCKW